MCAKISLQGILSEIANSHKRWRASAPESNIDIKWNASLTYAGPYPPRQAVYRLETLNNALQQYASESRFYGQAE